MWSRTSENTDWREHNLRYAFIANRCFCYVHLEFLVKELCVFLSPFLWSCFSCGWDTSLLPSCAAGFLWPRQSRVSPVLELRRPTRPPRNGTCPPPSSSAYLNAHKHTTIAAHRGNTAERKQNFNNNVKSIRFLAFQMKWMLIIFPEQLAIVLQWRQLYMTVQMVGLYSAHEIQQPKQEDTRLHKKREHTVITVELQVNHTSWILNCSVREQ